LASRRAATKIARVLAAPTDFCRLFLFRHPELDPAHAGVAIGDGEAALGRRGRAQALEWQQWVEGVELAAVHCSPQQHCLDAARALAAGRQLEPRPDARLRDQHMGRWQGRRWDELLQSGGAAVRAFFAAFGEAQPPDGESLGAAVERALAWWTTTLPGTAGRSLAVVLPGAVLSGLTAALLGMRLSRCLSLDLPHGGLGVLDAFQNGVRIACWNPGALA
jgi:broad specificity phosphatase PhoE